MSKSINVITGFLNRYFNPSITGLSYFKLLLDDTYKRNLSVLYISGNAALGKTMFCNFMELIAKQINANYYITDNPKLLNVHTILDDGLNIICLDGSLLKLKDFENLKEFAHTWCTYKVENGQVGRTIYPKIALIVTIPNDVTNSEIIELFIGKNSNSMIVKPQKDNQNITLADLEKEVKSFVKSVINHINN